MAERYLEEEGLYLEGKVYGQGELLKVLYMLLASEELKFTKGYALNLLEVFREMIDGQEAVGHYDNGYLEAIANVEGLSKPESTEGHRWTA